MSNRLTPEQVKTRITAIKLADQAGITRRHTAKGLGITPVALSRWIFRNAPTLLRVTKRRVKKTNTN